MSKRTIHSPETRWLFVAVRLPGIIEADEAAALLGVPAHAIPILIAAKQLKPLGKPTEKASKKFSAQYIEDLSSDRKWQDQAIRVIEAYWATQNSRKSKVNRQSVPSPG